METDNFKKIFINETEGHLSALESSLVDLEVDFNNKEIVRKVFRIMHTIKGNSGMFGFDKIVEVTHDLENIYDLVRSSKLAVTSELIDLSFTIIDHIRSLLHLKSNNNAPTTKHNEALNAIAEFKKEMKMEFSEQRENSTPEQSKKIRTWHILLKLDNTLDKRALNLFYIIQDLYEIGKCHITHANFETDNQSANIFLISDNTHEEIKEVLMFIEDYYAILLIAEYDLFEDNVASIPTFTNTTSASITEVAEDPDKYFNSLKNLETSQHQQHLSNTINVDVKKLDHLMFLVSELVTVKSELQNSLEQHDIESSIFAAEKIENLSKLFNQGALNLRLVPIYELTDKFKRQIRDLAKQVEKEVIFEVIGGDIELDKHIIDTLYEPLMHLLRNSIDHGIETPKNRIKKGKNRAGKITVKTAYQGNNVLVSISDNGNGIDKDKVYNKAVERGLIQPSAKISDKELYDLIFSPGFSTVKTLSNISGRGVGMDVVLKKIEEIRGEITVDSEQGVGTTFTLKLQQTISIVDTLLVEYNKIIYAVPINDIEACTFVPHNSKLKREHGGLVSLEGALTPYIYIEKELSDSEENNHKLVIIRKNSTRYALVVNKVIGEFQAVVKPLADTFKEMTFLMGATFLGDGSLSLLLDTEKLWDSHLEYNKNQNLTL